MKWIAVVLMCSIVDLASVNCECDLGTQVPYDPEEIAGSWYVVYTSPSVFDTFQNAQITYALEDETYNTTITTTLTNETTPTEFFSTWRIDESKDLDVKEPELPMFNGIYRVIAIQNGKYVIFVGCPEVFDGEDFIIIATAEKCPDEEMLKEAVENLKLDKDFSTDFSKDPAVQC